MHMHSYLHLPLPCDEDAYMNTCISLIMHSYILLILLTNIYLLCSETFNTAGLLQQ